MYVMRALPLLLLGLGGALTAGCPGESGGVDAGRRDAYREPDAFDPMLDDAFVAPTDDAFVAPTEDAFMPPADDAFTAPMPDAYTRDTGESVMCDGMGLRDCAAGRYCDFPFGTCGGTGYCAPLPSRLDCLSMPVATVCGCDGMDYTNTCAANAAGVDVEREGSCRSVSPTFACGDRMRCTRGTQYCQVTTRGPSASYECMRLPLSCVAADPPSCAACFRDLMAPASCTDDGAGAITIDNGGA